jgi:hypothetical protein
MTFNMFRELRLPELTLYHVVVAFALGRALRAAFGLGLGSLALLRIYLLAQGIARLLDFLGELLDLAEVVPLDYLAQLLDFSLDPLSVGLRDFVAKFAQRLLGLVG